MFNEPFGIGDAVTPAKMLDEADDPEAVFVPSTDEAASAAPVDEGGMLEEPTWLETALVDFGVSVMLLLGGVVDAAADGVEVES